MPKSIINGYAVISNGFTSSTGQDLQIIQQPTGNRYTETPYPSCIMQPSPMHVPHKTTPPRCCSQPQPRNTMHLLRVSVSVSRNTTTLSLSLSRPYTFTSSNSPASSLLYYLRSANSLSCCCPRRTHCSHCHVPCPAQ